MSALAADRRFDGSNRLGKSHAHRHGEKNVRDKRFSVQALYRQSSRLESYGVYRKKLGSSCENGRQFIYPSPVKKHHPEKSVFPTALIVAMVGENG